MLNLNDCINDMKKWNLDYEVTDYDNGNIAVVIYAPDDTYASVMVFDGNTKEYIETH